MAAPAYNQQQQQQQQQNSFMQQASAPYAAASSSSVIPTSSIPSSSSSSSSVAAPTHSSRPSSANGPPCVNPFVEYESLGVIGRGKYSEVHKACLRSNKSTIVAIKKVAIFEMDSDGRKECINEANILQSLPSHPHIIRYKQSYLYENDLYLVLELAESGDIGLLLEQQRKKGSYFQEAEIWHYFVQIADALHVMHQCRVMHRDIKPANVFLSGSPSNINGPGTPLVLTIKLGDLGLGRYLSSKTYQTFSLVGCIAPHTKVWLHSGEVIRADELLPHHRLIGDDGEPVSIVTNTLIGTRHFPMPPAPGQYLPSSDNAAPVRVGPLPDPDTPLIEGATVSGGWKSLRRIVGVDSTFDPFTVSDNHILTLACTQTQLLADQPHGKTNDASHGMMSTAGSEIPPSESDAATLLENENESGSNDQVFSLRDMALNEFELLPASLRGEVQADGSFSATLKAVKYHRPIVFQPANTWFRSQVNAILTHIDRPLRDGAEDNLMVRAAQLAESLLNPCEDGPTAHVFSALPRGCAPTRETLLDELRAGRSAVDYIAEYMIEMSAWMIGLWQASSDVDSEAGTCIADCRYESGIFAKCRHWIALLGLPDDYYRPDNAQLVYFHPTEASAEMNPLRRLLTQCGLLGSEGAVSKQLIFDPTFAARLGFQQLPPKSRLAFIAGLIDGSGELSLQSDCWQFTSQFEGLSEWLCLMCRQTGFTATRPIREESTRQHWKIERILAHYEHMRQLPLACTYKRSIKPCLDSHDPFLTPMRINPECDAAPSGLHSVVSFQVANASQRFLLSDGTITHNTPLYMSPEAIANTGYSFKSDIWSLGTLCYEIAALKSPFHSNALNFYVLGNKITKAEYEPPPQHFSKTLRSLIHWMIQANPDDRPDISQVLRVSQMACESISQTGTVSDSIPVGPSADCPPSTTLPQSRPSSKQGAKINSTANAASASAQAPAANPNNANNSDAMTD